MSAAGRATAGRWLVRSWSSSSRGPTRATTGLATGEGGMATAVASLVIMAALVAAGCATQASVPRRQAGDGGTNRRQPRTVRAELSGGDGDRPLERGRAARAARSMGGWYPAGRVHGRRGRLRKAHDLHRRVSGGRRRMLCGGPRQVLEGLLSPHRNREDIAASARAP